MNVSIVFWINRARFAEVFCDIIDDLEDACFENNILEIWNYNEAVVNNLSQEDILNAINRATISELTQVPYRTLLGKVLFEHSSHKKNLKQSQSIIHQKTPENPQRTLREPPENLKQFQRIPVNLQKWRLIWWLVGQVQQLG